MNVALLLEMAVAADPDRVALGSGADAWSYGSLRAGALALADRLADRPGDHVALLDLNTPAVPLALFASALAGKAFVPVSYRLAPDRLRAILARVAPTPLIIGPGLVPDGEPGVAGVELVLRDELLADAAAVVGGVPAARPGGGDDVAVVLFTSGTTGEPKAALLRHRHLTSYVLSTVELFGAAPDEAALVSVPPYHVAGVAAVLSSVYAGRRIVQLRSFSPEGWVAAVRSEAVTHAMVVPTMLGRILDVVDGDGRGLPTLRHLSYGGGRMPPAMVERALRSLPHVDFVNAYGLTETSSTIAVLGPDDHRRAVASDDPALRARLGSVGVPLPSIEVEVRDDEGRPVPTGQAGEIWVRGDQVAGEYAGTAQPRRADGWFPTRDRGHVDEAGYLFIDGRADDVIVRGGENISPGEVEDVLADHPAVTEAAVVGLPDLEWGERVVAAVVLQRPGAAGEDELQAWVRARLRSARVPERVVEVAALPYNETGKLLRRVVRHDLAAAAGQTSVGRRPGAGASPAVQDPVDTV